MENPAINYQALQFWFSVANAAVTGLIGLYVWLSSRQRATKRDIDAMDDRLIRIEKDVEHAPSRADIERLNDRISQIGNSVTGVEGELRQINRSLQLINDHLLNHGGK
jgi:tetrahydromethanopterin S-methyltransferase subunit G